MAWDQPVVVAPRARSAMIAALVDRGGWGNGGCTSADAAGLPIAPLLITADEVAAGEINHAFGSSRPNTRIAHRQYVRPATHATGSASAEVDGMPYGVRLRADYPLDHSR